MFQKIALFSFILFLIGASSCGTLKSPYYSDDALDWGSADLPTDRDILHALYLVGDAGEFDNETTRENYVLNALEASLKKESNESTLVFLGDNIYPAGLPKKDDPTRDISEDKLNIQIELARHFNGNTYFIPGNHDWNHYDEGGLQAIKRQEKYIENYFGKGGPKVKHYPSDGCADPKVLKINKDLVFVFLDTQWWLQDWKKEKKMNRGCEIKTRGDFLKTVEEIFTHHKNDEIVVLMHHPIKSNGLHGGNFSILHHVFPLHEKNIWLPLPIVGSIYPIYRQVTGSKQDITNVHNKEVVGGIESIAQKLGVHVIFAAGHEHGLQYFDSDKLKYIISGGASKNTYTKRGGEADYARDGRGYARIAFYEDNEAWLEIFTVAGFDQVPNLEFRRQIRAPRAGSVDIRTPYPAIVDKTKTIAAGAEFAASDVKEKLFGEQYRAIWTTPVEADIIDLTKELGGLTPIKKGGGMASNSLRMETASGKQYNLRSIRKDYTKLVPDDFDNLKLLDLLRDQNSAGHPYAPLVLPTLSQAANIYYINPKLVYLPHQRGLGNYNTLFNEELYLLEERPDGDWSDAEQFGNAEEIIGYIDLIDRLTYKKNHFIDQHWVLKSRLFDLWIHDWDRHDDQWRWAAFHEKNKTVYRPIPRDRDQAFYKFEGLVPWYVSTFLVRKFKTMEEDLKDVKYQSFNARNFDRYFINELEWDDWQSIISELQKNLTDDVIATAMSHFPKEVLELDTDEELTRLLKARRANLMDIGKRFFDILAKEVEIHGTDHKDLFEIIYKPNGAVHIKSYVKRDKKKDLLKYERTFYPSETKAIRIFGLRGKDDFIITGTDPSLIKISIVGGEDKDEIDNRSTSRRIEVYDNLDGAKLSGPLRDKRSHHVDVNDYDRTDHNYNSSLPLLLVGSTVDDGFWVGGSYAWTTHKWRKAPYASKQALSARIAPGSQESFIVGYNGHFPDVIDHIDFAPSVDIDFIGYENYFGLGNRSINPGRERAYNWVGLRSYEVAPMLQLNYGSRSHFKIGPLLQSHKIESHQDRVSTSADLGFSEDTFERRTYLGFQLLQHLEYVDHSHSPTNGIRLNAYFNYLKEGSRDEEVTEWGADLQFYIQLISRPKVVMANNIGYRRAGGDLQFYQYPDIGNLSYLRGFRNNRFRGEQVFFHNIDLRLDLFSWKNAFIPMEIGLLGGLDTGRAWLQGESSEQWHQSTTIGISLDLLGSAILLPHYSFNPEGDSFNLRLGFSF